jgi:hypothetical protein
MPNDPVDPAFDRSDATVAARLRVRPAAAANDPTMMLAPPPVRKTQIWTSIS